MRKKIVAGNWKMHKSVQESKDFAETLKSEITSSESEVEVMVFPTSIAVTAVAEQLSDTSIKVGVQNVHDQEQGAFTGEISAGMAKSAGARASLVGHSERREYFHEEPAFLLRKSKAVLDAGLTLVYCCGERLDQRESGRHFDVIQQQIAEVVFHLDTQQLDSVVIAYEPIWAIGTGVTATPEQAEEMHAHIREILASKYGQQVADTMSVLYGGSVKPNNAAELFNKPNIDGALVGGASLKIDDFKAIVTAMS